MSVIAKMSPQAQEEVRLASTMFEEVLQISFE
jgi:hypothetical protein